MYQKFIVHLLLLFQQLIVLVSCNIDIQVIEEENMWLRNEVLQLNQALINLDHMYKVEAAKARAFSLPAFNNIEENL